MSNPLKNQKMGNAESEKSGYQTRESLKINVLYLEAQVFELKQEIEGLKREVKSQQEGRDMYAGWWRESNAKIDLLNTKLECAKILMGIKEQGVEFEVPQFLS
jgi:hypothetical protein